MALREMSAPPLTQRPLTMPPWASWSRKTENVDRAAMIIDVDQFHAKAQVGSITSIAFHALGVRYAAERYWNVDIQTLFKEALDKSFDDRHQVVRDAKAHFDVDLCEFRLSVGA